MDDELSHRATNQAKECERQLELLRKECSLVLAELERSQHNLTDLRGAIDSALHPNREQRRFRVINGGRA